ncbi:MAG: DNA-directed RNA polymerase subunit B'' [Nanoarchaeota archaeon]|nr:DNA-directed RNA polymerase subunit B'' [Nanoarchaeota archaeon]
MLDGNVLIKKYFEDHSLIEYNRISFNNFIEKEIPKIVKEVGDIVPTVIPPDVNDFRIRFDNIRIEKPKIVEADGSRKDIYPMEARLRQLTYSAPMFLDVTVHIDGVQRESFQTPIGKLPVMLKSKFCNLAGLGREELIKRGEDPDDPGGYFVLNGNERALITVEDLVPNKMFVQESTGPSKFTAKIFSHKESYNIPHVIEQMRDGIIYISFTRFKRVPVMYVIKALGLVKDQDIMQFICDEKMYDEVYINLHDLSEVRTSEDALNALAAKGNINVQPKESKSDKALEQLDQFLLPHIGVTQKDRALKAYNLCKLVKKFLMISKDGAAPADKDHYKNKKLKLSGDLMAELMRVNMKVLVNDILYNFQRLVKRGKFQSVKTIIRDKLLTSRIKSAMATGTWVGGRKGISQNLDRINFIATNSHLTRVVSLLSATQENFEARELHCTHWGRLCPIETPEGTPIGLRKNMAMLCEITQEDVQEDKLKKSLEAVGLKKVA